MKLVTRYVVREHVGPLVFALSALTSLLMLQYVARQLANLAGKGLPWNAIAQFFVLSLPFTVAMTMPMAVLVATLYAFGRMAAEHEITAFKASGVRVRTLMLPVMFCALLLSLLMVGFNDQVLSRANHQLRMLQQDISRTKPTLALRDQVLIALTEQIYIRVGRSDAATNSMNDVTLYDLSRGTDRKTVYADSGLFLLAPNGRDLQMRLFHGYSQTLVKGDARKLQRDYFQQQTIQVRGISQGFEVSRGDSYKGEREMTVCEMQRKYLVTAKEFTRARQEYIYTASRLAPKSQKTITAPRDRPKRDWLGEFYCVTLPKLLPIRMLKAQGAPLASTGEGRRETGDRDRWQPPVKPPVQPPASQSAPVVKDSTQKVNSSTAPVPTPSTVPVQQGAAQPPVIQPSAVQPPVVQPPVAQPQVAQPGLVVPAKVDSSLAIPPGVVPIPAPPVNASQAALDSIQAGRGELLAATNRLTESRAVIDNVAVEIQKKFALSFACLVFVLFGPPIALRFPRGGVGVTIGVSIVVFGLYYICLMGGEALADKGMLPAFVAMWIANVTFAFVGMVLLWRIESTTDGSRGGGIRERLADRAVRRQLARERQAALATS